ncbi:signal transduction histidine kinase [Dyadobacter sp. BE34]|uniref:histidine kinase n=1 Tax=Dyadobacter fermentans TaxID=94254 RepID=A0ABU1R5Z3_9BACT|nr:MULTISPECIES: HAMP domain-containing sensor histidine kinase [Dyadobacter]MDR6808813.1 signal transduction histidine kinase [Dyadobacter fermentans]MDR7046556.1 signal transduction histidine kinase [Dyadobacter sp. BE242]MDR7200869.1 signal transduction histidine kinase [Dyadobacter sp. BE34]MDR7218829.1 signal transduction histidine kinase [Dyadobacter sp. BE31]MDR7266759.1 signal transduction histidine kinase [Dyadobacter sp. BE32]
MKLLERILKYQIVTSLCVLTLGAVLFYFSVDYLIDQEVNKELMRSKAKVSWQLRHIDELPVYILQLGDSLQLDQVRYPGQMALVERKLFNEFESEYQPYRQLIFYERVEGTWYRVTISKLLAQRQQLLEAVVMTVTFIVALLLISLLLLNSWLSRRLWRPFYKTLRALDSYEVEKHEVLTFPKQHTVEFEQLNQSVTQFTDRLAATYQNLKEFTGNASHEIQTPLAVILSKIEGLFQDESLKESQLVALSEISEAANRLAKLNQALLLLTKIENRQFLAGTEPISLVPIINRKLRDLEDLIEQREITVKTAIEPTGPVMHPALAEVLVNNLLTNAIRYNINGGTIDITLNAGKLVVRNTGAPIHVDPELMFERFRKEGTHSASLGLGLALAKTICQVNGQSLTYETEGQWHILTVTW